MSASIVYEIVKPKKSLYVTAPSWFQETIEKVFGCFPRTFSEEDIPKLDVIIQMAEKNARGFIELRELVEKHGKIKVSAEY